MSTRYLRAAAEGSADGSSWANAADSSTQLNAQLALAGPGGEVLLHADDTHSTGSVQQVLTGGGSPGARVVLRGAAADGSPARARVVGTRTPDWTAGQTRGSLWIKPSGLSHFEMRDLDILHTGYAVQAVDGTNSDWLIEDIHGQNVRGLFSLINLTGSTFRQSRLVGSARMFVKFFSGNSDILVEDCYVDAQQQNEPADQFVGFGCIGNTIPNHDITFRRCVARRIYHQPSDLSSYWNGDGFTSEEADYNLTYEDCHVYGSTDSGFDLKSATTRLVRPRVEGAKRNYRLWGHPVEIIDPISIDPVLSGGSGTAAHIYAMNGAAVRLRGGLLKSSSAVGSVYETGAAGTSIRHDGGRVIRPAGMALDSVFAGSTISRVDTRLVTT